MLKYNFRCHYLSCECFHSSFIILNWVTFGLWWQVTVKNCMSYVELTKCIIIKYFIGALKLSTVVGPYGGSCFHPL